jgi:hypothetical protein
MKLRAVIVVGLLLTVCWSGIATSKSFNVDKSYNSTDTLLTSDSGNDYKITAEEFDKIKYSVKVKDGNTVKIFLVQGHNVDFLLQYYQDHSVAGATQSYSNTFDVGDEDGTKFTILIQTDEMENVTYDVNIEVVNPLEGMGSIFLILSVIGVVVVVFLALGHYVSKKRRKQPPVEVEALPSSQSSYQQPPQQWEPPSQQQPPPSP